MLSPELKAKEPLSPLSLEEFRKRYSQEVPDDMKQLLGKIKDIFPYTSFDYILSLNYEARYTGCGIAYSENHSDNFQQQQFSITSATVSRNHYRKNVKEFNDLLAERGVIIPGINPNLYSSFELPIKRIDLPLIYILP